MGERDPRIPRLAEGWAERGPSLRPEEGFLLSRIDGQTSWGMLREIGGLPPEQVDACLARWLGEGLLEIEGEPAPEAIDSELDLTVELQREILAFEGRIVCSYHELLGVDLDADAKAIKRAYFRLSKKFHPDRYFRRQLGAFRGRLERIFKRLAEAYELLSDPATRAEIERTLCGEPSAPPQPATTPRPRTAVSRKRETLERLRRSFRIPEQMLAERRLKARIFYDASRTAFEEERWLEAAASARLAVAFDPWEERYRAGFSEVQMKAYEFRAAELLQRDADDRDAGARQEALRLYEEVVHYRPGDAAVQGRGARLALELGELEKAREFAEAACEIEPDVVAHHATLCRALRKAGDLSGARAALRAGERLDRRDPVLGEERRALQQAGRRG